MPTSRVIRGIGPNSNYQKAALGCTFDAGSADISVGAQGDVTVPWDCTITGATVLGNVSGSIEIDIWTDTYSNYPPTIGDSLVSITPPKLVAQQKSQDVTLTDWIVNLSAGSTLRFNINSCTGVQRAVITLQVNKT